MEKLGKLLIGLLLAIWDRLEAKKADRDHAASVRADPGSAWLRRFGGKDERSASPGSGNGQGHSD